jgi:hypothetical protein
MIPKLDYISTYLKFGSEMYGVMCSTKKMTLYYKHLDVNG